MAAVTIYVEDPVSLDTYQKELDETKTYICGRNGYGIIVIEDTLRTPILKPVSSFGDHELKIALDEGMILTINRVLQKLVGSYPSPIFLKSSFSRVERGTVDVLLAENLSPDDLSRLLQNR